MMRITLDQSHPELAAQWHPTKNGTLTPADTTHCSGKPVWWRCNAGPDHEWRVSPAARKNGLMGCPFCSGFKTSVTNSLATLFPIVASQWHKSKNGKLSAANVIPGSTKVVWWKCDAGPDHEWRVQVRARTQRGDKLSCPFCSGKKVSISNSLQSLYPKFAALWHPVKNGRLKPSDVVAGSCKPVWWQCPESPDHVWRDSPAHRVRAMYLCPFCWGQRVSVTNSLQTKFPELAEQWHPTKNGSLTPSEVMPGSDKIVWWKCPKGLDHEWKLSVRARTQSNTLFCPYCADRIVSLTNSLATRYPLIARQWHIERNEDLAPQDVPATSLQTVWWRCAKGHEWRSRVRSRTIYGMGCPKCKKTQPKNTQNAQVL